MEILDPQLREHYRSDCIRQAFHSAEQGKARMAQHYINRARTFGYVANAVIYSINAELLRRGVDWDIVE